MKAWSRNPALCWKQYSASLILSPGNNQKGPRWRNFLSLMLTFNLFLILLKESLVPSEPWDPCGCLLCWYFHMLSRFSLEPRFTFLPAFWLGSFGCFPSASFLIQIFVTEFTSDSLVQTRFVILDSSLSLPFHLFEHLMCTDLGSQFKTQFVCVFWTPDPVHCPFCVHLASCLCLFYRPAPLACFCSREWAPPKFLASSYPSAWPLASLYLMRNEWSLWGTCEHFIEIVYSQLNKKISCHLKKIYLKAFIGWSYTSSIANTFSFKEFLI